MRTAVQDRGRAVSGQTREVGSTTQSAAVRDRKAANAGEGEGHGCGIAGIGRCFILLVEGEKCLSKRLPGHGKGSESLFPGSDCIVQWCSVHTQDGRPDT